MRSKKANKMRKVFIIILMIIIGIGVIYKLFLQGTQFSDMLKKFIPFLNTKTLQQAAMNPGQVGAQLAQQGQQALQGGLGSGAADERPIAIKAFTVAKFDFKDYLNALGSIKGGVEFKLSYEIPGIIESINYRPGEKYGKGALLVSLKQEDILLRLRRAEAKEKKARASEEIAKNKFQEHEKLFSIGAIPQSTLERVRLEYEAAQYESEDAILQVRSEEIILEKSNLYAPSAGMIGELNIEVGEAVTSNTLLGTHILIEYVRAEFGVIERDVPRIAVGQQALVYVDSYPDKVFYGSVDNVSPLVTGTSRTANAEIRIDNKDGLLLPGAFARIRILLFEKNNAIVVPTEAVLDNDGQQTVFLVNEDNTVTQQKVSVDYAQANYTVIGEGLSADQLVALTALDKLKDGSRVEVLEKQQM